MNYIKGNEAYIGIRDAFKRIYKEEGIQSLYRGNLANLSRYAIS